jgi:hypothetical protein
MAPPSGVWTRVNMFWQEYLLKAANSHQVVKQLLSGGFSPHTAGDPIWRATPAVAAAQTLVLVGLVRLKLSLTIAHAAHKCAVRQVLAGGRSACRTQLPRGASAPGCKMVALTETASVTGVVSWKALRLVPGRVRNKARKVAQHLQHNAPPH